MAYCEADDVKANHERIPESEDDTVISSFIDRADGLINGYLRSKYKVPFVVVPEIIKGISIDIATYYELRRLFGAQQSEFQEWITDFYAKPLEILKSIQKGEINLDETSVTKYQEVKSNTSGKEAIFNLADTYTQIYHPEENDERYGVQ